MRPCHYKKYLGCKLHQSQCPVEDRSFTGALAFYLKSGPKTPNAWGGNGGDILPLDIAILFKGEDWELPVARFLDTGKIRMTRALCNQLREARFLWWLKRFSPRNYDFDDWDWVDAREQLRDNQARPGRRYHP